MPAAVAWEKIGTGLPRPPRVEQVHVFRMRQFSGPYEPSGSAPTFSRRIRVKVHRSRLDHQLADGLDPASAGDRALRASQLAALPARRRVARSLRGVVSAADRPTGSLLGAAIPVSRRTVIAWRHGLLGLAERLERREPVNPCGVARALVLLTDGAGPLYDPRSNRSMGDAVWWIADGLQL